MTSVVGRRPRAIGRRAAAFVLVAAAASGCSTSSAPRRWTSIDSSVLSADGHDAVRVTVAGRSVTMRTLPTNKPVSNLRVLMWPHGQRPRTDATVCATWTGQASGVVQQGLALRITTDGSRTRALTITKNVVYGVQTVFNVLAFDTALPLPDPFTIVAQHDLSSVLAGHDALAPFPWRVCARVIGPLLTFKVWRPDAQAEPAWNDPVHSVTATVPSGLRTAGRFGWYAGHLPAGDTERYDDVTAPD